MAAPVIKYTIGNSASTTLSTGMTTGDTTTPLTSSTNFQAKSGEGMIKLDEGLSTQEFAYSTGIAGGALTTPVANRGLEGGSPQAHSSQGTVRGIITAGMWNGLVDSVLNILNQTTGAVKSFNMPSTGSINDANGNELVKFPSSVSSAVNEVTVTNAATGNAPSIAATGGDTNIPLALAGKGTGGVTINGVTQSATAPSAGQVLTASSATAASWAAGSSTDGWTSSSDTWTYASASTFTIAGVDRTTTFTKGTRLKFTQTTAKYAVVVSSSYSTDTTVTIAINTDYTIANAAITSPYYSYQASPQGYPTYFNYTPGTYTGSGSMTYGSVSTILARFSVIGTTCTVFLNASGTIGGTPSYGIDFSLPITASNRYALSGSGVGNTSGSSRALTVSNYNLNSTTLGEISIYDVGNWSAGTRDFAVGFQYQI